MAERISSTFVEYPHDSHASRAKNFCAKIISSACGAVRTRARQVLYAGAVLATGAISGLACSSDNSGNTPVGGDIAADSGCPADGAHANKDSGSEHDAMILRDDAGNPILDDADNPIFIDADIPADAAILRNDAGEVIFVDACPPPDADIPADAINDAPSVEPDSSVPVSCAAQYTAACAVPNTIGIQPFPFIAKLNHGIGNLNSSQVPAAGAGLCSGDFNNDGAPDIAVINQPGVDVYSNNGDASFTLELGTDVPNNATACLFADYDNDNDKDLLVAGDNDNRLFRNNFPSISPVFTDVTTDQGILAGERFFAMTAGDFDKNGYVDFLLSGYTKPNGSLPAPSLLFMGNGSGFTEERASRMIGNPGAMEAFRFTNLAYDMEDDGDLDIIDGKDPSEFLPNSAFTNDGTGNFDDQADTIGFNPALAADRTDTMGFAVGDYDLDGRQEVAMTGYACQHTVLMECGQVQNGDLCETQCEERWNEAGLGGIINRTNWSIEEADFDHDGDQDLFLWSSFSNPGQSEEDCGLASPTRKNTLLENVGGSFIEYAPVDGSDALAAETHSHGGVADDFNGDGTIDLIGSNGSFMPPQVLINQNPQGNYIKFDLDCLNGANEANCVGAGVTVDLPGGCALTKQVTIGGNFAGAQTGMLDFGLGDAAETHATVKFLDGTEKDLGTLNANQTVAVDDL